MREILFRGKQFDGEWIFGIYLDENHIGIFHDDTETKDCEIDVFQIIPETLGEYTGLTDKNGKRIFEGDILMGIDPNATGEICHACATGEEWDYIDDGISLCKIYFSNAMSVGFSYRHTYPTVGQSILFASSVFDKVIIGNVYDTPQLLENKNQALIAYAEASAK